MMERMAGDIQRKILRRMPEKPWLADKKLRQNSRQKPK